MAGFRAARILLVAPAPPPYGGMALQARQLEKLLALDGHAVRFFASNFPLPRFLNRLAGVRTLTRICTIWFKLLPAVRSAEIVHVMAASWLYFFLVVYPAVVVGRICGKRVVVNYRGGEAEAFFRGFAWITRPVFAMAAVVTAPSEFLAEIIRRRFGVPVLIVPNLLDSSLFRYRERSAFQPRMLVTRHLEKIYDIETVLRAVGCVQRTYPQASLWIAGSGSEAARLRELTASMRLSNVRFLGSIPHRELPAIYDQCDIYLNASRVDNFPGALVEASAAGLAVVTTAAGGIPFLYRNGETGWLVEPGDWEGLATAVQNVLEEQVRTSMITKAATEIARSCEWSEVRKWLYAAYGLSEAPAIAVPMTEGTGCAAG
jgi:glycosyltransferase involved in cell wall biosynthesis